MLDRFLGGEQESVWNELIDNGASFDVRNQIVQEVATRFVDNLREIKSFFLEVGFEFENQASVIVPADESTALGITQIEQEVGELPAILKAIYSTIDSTNFEQSDRQRHSGVGPQCEGIVPESTLNLNSPQQCLAARTEYCQEVEKERALLRKLGKEAREDTSYKQFLPLGSCASNCDLIGYQLPCSNVDAPIYDDGGGETTFVEHYRDVFLYKGGVEFYFIGPNPTGSSLVSTSPERRDEIVNSLVKRLQPI